MIATTAKLARISGTVTNGPSPPAGGVPPGCRPRGPLDALAMRISHLSVVTNAPGDSEVARSGNFEPLLLCGDATSDFHPVDFNAKVNHRIRAPLARTPALSVNLAMSDQLSRCRCASGSVDIGPEASASIVIQLQGCERWSSSEERRPCRSHTYRWDPADGSPGSYQLALLLVLGLSASAAETPSERCERATNVEAAIEACSSVIQADNDHHRLAMSYFNRAGWYLKKDDVNRAASDLSEAIGLEPDFAAALTKRGLLEERHNDLRSARADFAAVLKLPTTNSLSAWAHAMARERLAATEAAATKSGRSFESRPESIGSGYFGVLEKTSHTDTPRMQREAIPIHQTSGRKRCV